MDIYHCSGKLSKVFPTLFIFFSGLITAQNDLVQIRPFGTNPGNLKLMFYDPGNITEKSPLVVVLHGCTQTAQSCAEQTGWNKLAKLHQFYVLYPEQIILNNPENCFNWYRSSDQMRDKGEPGSIMQMISYLKTHKKIDSTRIYVIGLSAGGAMSSIMMALYPKVFDKGGVMAGGPYKSAESVVKAGPAMLGMVSKSPEEWGNLVREQNVGYKGFYPELIVFHGGMDPVVSPNNANQLIKQWVNLHQADYEEDEYFSRFNNNDDVELSIFKKKDREVVRYFRVKGIGHTLPLDTGSCSTQGGKTGMFSIQKKFHSTFWAADFFGVINPPYSIMGEKSVKHGTKNLIYSAPFHDGSIYNWKTPAGMWTEKGRNTHEITIQADYQSGFLQLTETDKNGCVLEPVRIWIDVNEN